MSKILKFKSFQLPNGEFGHFDYDFRGELFIGTSTTPMLLQPTATIEMAKSLYNGAVLSRFDMLGVVEGDTHYDWDTHTPDWKLVDVEVRVKEGELDEVS